MLGFYPLGGASLGDDGASAGVSGASGAALSFSHSISSGAASGVQNPTATGAALAVTLSLNSGPIGEIVLTGGNYTATQLTTGLLGGFDYGTAGKILFPPGNNTAAPGALVFEFTGTGGTVAMFQNASQPTDMVEVSIDGGSFASAGSASGGVYTFASALSDTTHTAIIRINAGYGVSAHLPDTGTVLTVTGAAPTVTLPRASQMQTSGLGATIMKSANAFTDALSGIDVRTPTGIQSPGRIVNTFAGNGLRNASSLRIRTNATKIWIYGEDSYCWIFDGTTTTRYTLNGINNGGAGAGLTKLTGFSGLKNYSIWTANIANQVIAPFDDDFYTVPNTGTFDEYGDSIAEFTSGNTVSEYGYAAVYQCAVALGRIGSNFGISGNSIANLKARIDAILANKEVSGIDVAFLTIGRNNIGGAFDGTETSDYQYIVSALLAAGYGRIICRGLLPEGVQTWSGENGSISSIVAGFANSKIVYMDPSPFTGLSTHDQTHLNVTGANQLTAYQVAALPALIGSLTGAATAAGVALTVTQALAAGVSTGTASATGAGLTETLSISAGAASAGAAGNASGAALSFAETISSGAATGVRNPTASGSAISITLSLAAGTANAGASGNASGASLTIGQTVATGASTGTAAALGSVIAYTYALASGAAFGAGIGTAPGAVLSYSMAKLGGAALASANTTGATLSEAYSLISGNANATALAPGANMTNVYVGNFGVGSNGIVLPTPASRSIRSASRNRNVVSPQRRRVA